MNNEQVETNRVAMNAQRIAHPVMSIIAVRGPSAGTPSVASTSSVSLRSNFLGPAFTQTTSEDKKTVLMCITTYQDHQGTSLNHAP